MKAGLNALTDSLRQELASYHIRVTAICPGYMITGFHRNALSEMEMPQSSRLVCGTSADAVAAMIKSFSPRLT